MAVATSPPRTGAAVGPAQVRAAHLAFAGVVAGLDPADRAVWVVADRAVARVSAEAYDVASALTGDRWTVAEPGVQPVVRVRELSVAQRRMAAALEALANGGRLTEFEPALSDSASRVMESARWLGIVSAAIG